MSVEIADKPPRDGNAPGIVTGKLQYLENFSRREHAQRIAAVWLAPPEHHSGLDDRGHCFGIMWRKNAVG